jgi:hypothetical protein
MASQTEFDFRVGLAADRGYIPWQSEAFTKLREFLGTIRFLRRKPILDSAEKKNAFVAGELAKWRYIAESTDFNQK